MSPLTAPQRRVARSRPARARRAATKSPEEKQQSAAQDRAGRSTKEAGSLKSLNTGWPDTAWQAPPLGLRHGTILKLSEKTRWKIYSHILLKIRLEKTMKLNEKDPGIVVKKKESIGRSGQVYAMNYNENAKSCTRKLKSKM